MFGDRWNFWGEMEEIFGEMSKNGHSRIQKNFVENLVPRFWSTGSASDTTYLLMFYGSEVNERTTALKREYLWNKEG